MSEQITFKAFFSNENFITETLTSLLSEKTEKFSLEEKLSSNGKFISLTITVPFICEEELNALTQSISTIDGFRMML